MSGMFRTYQNALWQSQTLPGAGDRKTTERKRPAPRSDLSDEIVLEMRSRHEYHCWTTLKVSRHYGINQQRTRNLLDYQTRGNLIPKPEHANLEAPCTQPT